MTIGMHVAIFKWKGESVYTGCHRMHIYLVRCEIWERVKKLFSACKSPLNFIQNHDGTGRQTFSEQRSATLCKVYETFISNHYTLPVESYRRQQQRPDGVDSLILTCIQQSGSCFSTIKESIRCVCEMNYSLWFIMFFSYLCIVIE